MGKLRISAALTAACVASIVTGADAQRQSSEMMDMAALRAQLGQIQGVHITMGGIDTNDALRKISAAIIELDRRLQELEKKK